MSHWNEEDPVTDEAYPNIKEYVPSVDDPQWPSDEDDHVCFSKTMEEVNPEDG